MLRDDVLTTLFRHHRWANLGLLERCAPLGDAQLDATVAGTYGTIRDTLQHLVRAEQGYVSRITTGQRLQRPDDEPPMSMAQMAASLEETGDALIAWAGRVAAGDVVEIDWDGTMRDVPKAVLMAQAINHATEHRSQIMTILTQLGIEPPELDGWTYFEAHDR
jgi:uncharacterized damage-inducible protein DinB